MGEQYFRGVLAAYLGTGFMTGPITEWQIDMIKESISHYQEAMIDHTIEKEQQKLQMKQSLEAYFQGVKDEMRTVGRMG